MRRADSIDLERQPSLQRAESIRGLASDILPARRRRMLSNNQLAIVKWIYPVLTLVLLFVIICSVKVFGVDSSAVKSLNGSLYFAGLILQIYFCFMAVRDISLTLRMCKADSSAGLPIILGVHYAFSCFDMFLLGGLTIWATIAVNDNSTAECLALPEESGCDSFLKATRANLIIGWLYLVAHCCSCPIFCLIAACNPNMLRGGDREFLEDYEDADFIDADRPPNPNQADAAIKNLPGGIFSQVASSIVKIDQECQCAICFMEFDGQDDVTELSCNKQHIYHTDCLRPWLERNMSCPICRAEVTVN